MTLSTLFSIFFPFYHQTKTKLLFQRLFNPTSLLSLLTILDGLSVKLFNYKILSVDSLPWLIHQRRLFGRFVHVTSCPSLHSNCLIWSWWSPPENLKQSRQRSRRHNMHHYFEEQISVLYEEHSPRKTGLLCCALSDAFCNFSSTVTLTDKSPLINRT